MPQHLANHDHSLAQAKTGTGKTLAFLIPTMQNILQDPTFAQARGFSRGRSGASAGDVRALIISPTRELAEQIAAEAMKVAANTGLVVQTAVGGTRKQFALQKMQREGCHLLVGTPGRLKDIFSDPRSGVAAPKLNTLILDEADRLLDDGFSQEIKELQTLLPDPYKVDRQTLMLSATVPREVMRMVNQTMKPGYKFVKTVREDEAPTHMRVPQKAIFMKGYENSLPCILDIAKEYKARQMQDSSLRPFKAIIYNNSTGTVSLSANVFEELRVSPEERRHPLGRTDMIEIHAKLTQAQRTRAANSFRSAREAILFSSDVTARGMDFPDVTHVIQVGVPRDRVTYVHRLGRTARANKTGEGWILLAEDERSSYRKMLNNIPIQEDSTSFPIAKYNMEQGVTGEPDSSLAQVQHAMSHVSPSTREVAWKSMLGTVLNSYNDRRSCVIALNALAVHGYCLTEAPPTNPRLAQSLGISRIRELNMGRSRSFDDDERPARSFGRDFDRGSNRGFGGRGSDRGFGGRRSDRGFGGRGSDRGFGGRGRGSGDSNDRRPRRHNSWEDMESGGFGGKSRDFDSSPRSANYSNSNRRSLFDDEF